MSAQGKCEHCEASFVYDIWHTGFGDSAYAYCEECGCVAMLNGWTAPRWIKLRIHEAIPEEIESELQPCECGGTFRRNASPRCPKCRRQLSPDEAAMWIEANAPETAKGWRWQRSWTGLYAICIEKRVARDPWKNEPNQSSDLTPSLGMPPAGQESRRG
jgi:hypothetical protein